MVVTGRSRTYVHMCPVAWRAHEDPVCFGGLSGLREEVGAFIVVPQDVSGGRVTVTPEGRRRESEREGGRIRKGCRATKK